MSVLSFCIVTLEASAAGAGICRCLAAVCCWSHKTVRANCIGAAMGMPRPRRVCGGKEDSMCNCKTHAHITGMEKEKGLFLPFQIF